MFLVTICRSITRDKLYPSKFDYVYENTYCKSKGWYITTCEFNKYLDYCIHRLEKYSPAPIKGILVPLKKKEEFDSYKNIPIQYIYNTLPRKSGNYRLKSPGDELHARLIGHSNLEYPCRVIDADLFINEHIEELMNQQKFVDNCQFSWIISLLNDQQKWLWG